MVGTSPSVGTPLVPRSYEKHPQNSTWTLELTHLYLKKKKKSLFPTTPSTHWLVQLKSAWDSKKGFSKVCYRKEKASLGSGCYRPLTHIPFFLLNGMVIDQSKKIYRKRYCCHVFKACVSQPSLQMESPKQHILDLNVTV